MAVAVGLAVISALIVLDEVLFRVLFDTDYPRWFLANGALIGITFTLFTVVWGDVNDKLTHLISAHPLGFAASCFELMVLPTAALSSALRFSPLQTQGLRKLGYARAESKRVLRESPSPSMRALAEKMEAEDEATKAAREEAQPPHNLGVVDIWLALAFSAALFVVYFAWLLVVAPLQYVVNLFAGSVSRIALASPVRAWVRFTPRETVIEYAEKSAEMPEDAVESGFSAKPVTYTAAVSTALLFMASKLVG